MISFVMQLEQDSSSGNFKVHGVSWRPYMFSTCIIVEFPLLTPATRHTPFFFFPLSLFLQSHPKNSANVCTCLNANISVSPKFYTYGFSPVSTTLAPFFSAAQEPGERSHSENHPSSYGRRGNSSAVIGAWKGGCSQKFGRDN